MRTRSSTTKAAVDPNPRPGCDLTTTSEGALGGRPHIPGAIHNEERLDGENGLLLTPTIDQLFDRGFIGFENSGELIVSPVAHAPSLNRMGVATDRVVNVGTFTTGQKHFLEFHRASRCNRTSPGYCPVSPWRAGSFSG
jgi:hypothetical protein